MPIGSLSYILLRFHSLEINQGAVITVFLSITDLALVGFMSTDDRLLKSYRCDNFIIIYNHMSD